MRQGTWDSTKTWRWIGPLVVVLAAVAFSLPKWSDPVHWTPDALFYQAESLEVRGEPAQQARHDVWTGPLAASLRNQERTHPSGAPKFTDLHWVDYSGQFYRRRWSVPVLTAALNPVEHNRSLLIVSLLGYVAIGLAAYALLRTSFGYGASTLAAVIVLALPAVRDWSFSPGTESWGVALECLALLAAVLALRRGRWWLIPWVAAMVALAFTRDATVVALAAVAWVALFARTRRSFAVLGTGVLAAAPAALLFGAPWATTIHYEAADYHIPAAGRSLSSDYTTLLKDVVTGDGGYLFHRQPLMGLAVLVTIAGLALLVWRRRPAEGVLSLWPGMVIGCVAMLLINPLATEFRLELVWVPVIAVGLAVAAEYVAEALRPRLGRRAPSAAA